MDLGLKGKRAILAGATKGIGRAVAETLAGEGCDVAICARDTVTVNDTISSLRRKGINAIGESVDVTDAGAYRGWITSAAATLGGCDIFMCFTSAGGGPASEERWRAAFDVDLLPTYRGIDAALPFLEKSDSASIVVMATSVAIEPIFGAQSFSAIRAALLNYASALSQTLAPKNIRVNAVSPGPIYFDGGSWDKIKTHRPELYQSTLSKIPMGRLGQGDEVGRAIVFLASPACRFMTGVNLVIDGGLTRRVQH